MTFHIDDSFDKNTMTEMNIHLKKNKNRKNSKNLGTDDHLMSSV